jgi:transcriptional regulator with XRE-family HTH domain
MSIKNLDGIQSLQKKYGPMSLGLFLRSIREADEISQIDFAKKLKISRANLCDIEKGRKLLSPERAMRFAKLLKLPEMTLIKLSLQDSLRQADAHYTIELTKAS